ncbi:MAG: hypothetical protein A2901_00005 [Elusimicrobia bacterium RIFCSPLOWO2_01_FULL_54_10]|nr:MAG: hypothetical protein A2901_00005 [Elusimicrobia bacterium RIFCSPLOWO2_01_FULL_54_10]
MRPRLIVISGATGAGKSTVAGLLMEKQELRLRRVVTCTTRAKRASETGGVQYHFISSPQFEQELSEGKIIVPNKFAGNNYGTRKADIDAIVTSGEQTLVTLDITGSKTICEIYPNALVFYIWAPLETLVARSKARGTAGTNLKQRHEEDPLLSKEEVERLGFVPLENSAAPDVAVNNIADVILSTAPFVTVGIY